MDLYYPWFLWSMHAFWLPIGNVLNWGLENALHAVFLWLEKIELYYIESSQYSFSMPCVSNWLFVGVKAHREGNVPSRRQRVRWSMISLSFSFPWRKSSFLQATSVQNYVVNSINQSAVSGCGQWSIRVQMHGLSQISCFFSASANIVFSLTTVAIIFRTKLISSDVDLVCVCPLIDDKKNESKCVYD